MFDIKKNVQVWDSLILKCRKLSFLFFVLLLWIETFFGFDKFLQWDLAVLEKKSSLELRKKYT